MIQKHIKIIPNDTADRHDAEKLTYWRSSPRCFSIHYKGIITEICEGSREIQKNISAGAVIGKLK